MWRGWQIVSLKECAENSSVYLRAITRDDTVHILRWRNSDTVRKQLFTQEKLTRKQHEQWLLHQVESGRCRQFIITTADQGRPIGTVFLKNLDYVDKKGELGIFIGDEEYYGYGIGTLAVKAAVSYAFLRMGLEKVYLFVKEENTRAIRCYQKAGFVQEGYLKDDLSGKSRRDTLIMAVYNRENVEE